MAGTLVAPVVARTHRIILIRFYMAPQRTNAQLLLCRVGALHGAPIRPPLSLPPSALEVIVVVFMSSVIEVVGVV